MGLCQHFEIQAKGSRFVSVISRQMIDRKPAADADASNIKGWWSASLLHKKLNDPTMCTTTLSCSSAYACAQRKQQQLTKPSPSNDSGIDSGIMQFSFFIVLFFLILFPSLSRPPRKIPTPAIGTPPSPKRLQWSPLFRRWCVWCVEPRSAAEEIWCRRFHNDFRVSNYSKR